jgi:type IV pilus assembly protein PilA
MTGYFKGLGKGQGGFTLIELLIVVAILGIIAAVAIPNVGAFMTSGTLNAANTEVQNVKTAAVAYYADHQGDASPVNGGWPDTSAALGSYLTGDIKGVYTFGSDGLIASALAGGWSDINFDAVGQKWLRGAATP